MSKVKKTLCSVLAIIGCVVGGVSIPDASLNQDAPPVGEVVINGQTIGTLIVSQNALLVIGNAEGCVREPYRCPAGKLTDGIGNTHGEIGKAKTDEEIAIDWTRNILSAQSCLQRSGDVNVMTQGQIDGFTSFIFNVGCHVFRYNADDSLTMIYSLIKHRQFNAACEQLHRWVYSEGKVLPGLVTRRQTETDICLSLY